MAAACCWASSWSSDRATKTPAADLAERVLYRALSRGLSFKTTMGNVLTLTPPLITTVAQMDAALDILDAMPGYTLSGIVTGPSLTRCTCMSAPNVAGRDRRVRLPRQFQHTLVELRGRARAAPRP